MKQIEFEVEGMMCGMCESHIQEAIRNSFTVKKVKASRSTGKVIVLTEVSLPIHDLKETIEKTGYHCLSCRMCDYVKPSLFKRLFSGL